MPDKKTDAEIKKALECHNNMRYDNNACGGCPFLNHCDCSSKMSELALDLINRLQAENERLEYENKKLDTAKNLFSMYVQTRDDVIAEAKAEAYKECIEKVKKQAQVEIYCDNRLPKPIITYHITEDKLDNLLKELVGE